MMTAESEPASDLARLYLLDPQYTFLNNGSFGAVPVPIFSRYLQLQREMESHPAKFLKNAYEGRTRSREALAAYLGTTTDRIALVTNVTAGINLIARSLRLCAQDEILSTDHEYGSINGAWRFVANRRSAAYINVPIPVPVRTPEEVVDALWQGVTPRTRVITFSHITSPTALTFPAKLICARAREAGILSVVDGAHVPGHIRLDLDDLGADFYSGNLHKWAGAPKGTAFIYARPDVQDLIEPLVAGMSPTLGSSGPASFVDKVQNLGTRDPSRFLVIPEVIAFLHNHDWPGVQARCHEMVRQAQKRICALSDRPPLHPDDGQWFGQMAACPLPATDTLALRNRLYDEYKIETTIYPWNRQPLIRVSIQAYNTQSDVDRLVDALTTILR